MDQDPNAYEEAAREAVDLGNRIANSNPENDLWDVADGLLAGAIQYWLYTRQPCGDPMCEDCEPISNADQRLIELLRTAEEMARESDYYHAATDTTVGHA